jgi:uncharacterized protein YdcH (DUF465 family)
VPITTDDIRQSLLEVDPEFRRLAEEHFCCEVRLEQIQEEPYVNSENLIQESILKKQKLYLKDQMELIVARYQQGIIEH